MCISPLLVNHLQNIPCYHQRRRDLVSLLLSPPQLKPSKDPLLGLAQMGRSSLPAGKGRLPQVYTSIHKITCSGTTTDSWKLMLVKVPLPMLLFKSLIFFVIVKYFNKKNTLPHHLHLLIHHLHICNNL
jgi:hypothetical protein